MKELEYTTNYCGCDVYTENQPKDITDGFALVYSKHITLDDHYEYRLIKGSQNMLLTTRGMADEGKSLCDFIAEFKASIKGDL